MTGPAQAVATWLTHGTYVSPSSPRPGVLRPTESAPTRPVPRFRSSFATLPATRSEQGCALDPRLLVACLLHLESSRKFGPGLGAGYWAEVSDLPGCFASGRTLTELREALGEAIGLYLWDRPIELAASPLGLGASELCVSAPAGEA